MRRYHRDPAILNAAVRWRDRCLLDDRSGWSLRHRMDAERGGCIS